MEDTNEPTKTDAPQDPKPGSNEPTEQSEPGTGDAPTDAPAGE